MCIRDRYQPTGPGNTPNGDATVDGEYLSKLHGSDEVRSSSTEVVPEQQLSPATKKSTHYTTIGPDRLKTNNVSPSGIVPSLLVIAGLVISIGTLLAFTNWYNQPRSADELLELIEDAKLTPGSDWGQASKEMQEFLDRFPEHQQFSAVQDYYNSLKGQRDEQQFLKSLNNDLDLLPIAKITLSQILKSDTSSPREKITQLNHFITLYAARKDDEVASE